MPRGRPPKPAHRRRLDGDTRKTGRRAHTAASISAAAFELAAPAAPEWLPPAARTEWRRLMRDYSTAGVLARVDRNLLARYCDLHARYVTWTLEATGDDHYDYVNNDNGTTSIHPRMKLLESARRQLQTMEDALFLTPLARLRARLQPLPPQITAAATGAPPDTAAGPGSVPASGAAPFGPVPDLPPGNVLPLRPPPGAEKFLRKE